MVVLDNIIFSLQRAGGISGAWSELIFGLLRTEIASELRFVEREDARANIFRRRLNIPDDQIIRPIHRPLIIDRYMPVSLPKTLAQAPFIFHSSYYRYCPSPRARCVVTLHDFIYEKTHFRPYLATTVHTRQKRTALRHAAAIINVSQATRTDLAERYPDFAGKCVVIPHAPLTPPYTGALPRSTDRVLYVGGRQTYKNFHCAAHAVSLLPDIRLIIAGPALTPGERKELDHIIPGQYEVVENPSSEKLAELYATSACLLYPSEAEGFGLPILEARAAGCPVVISRDAACRETASLGGNPPSMVWSCTPHPLAIKEAIQHAIGHSSTTTKLTLPTWPEITEKHLSLYLRLI